MNKNLINQLISKVFLAVAIACCSFTSAAAQAGQSTSYNFRVFLDDKPIGYHQFELDHNEAGKQVASEAQFNVKLLFITAFKYRHSSVERWDNNCVAEIESNTRSNGKRQQVKGERVGNALNIESTAGDKSMDGCVQTFAYWNPSILDATKLLNSQTGDYVEVQVKPLGQDIVTLGKEKIVALKYNLKSAPDYAGKPVDITLWYDNSGTEWLALESPAKGNRTLRYERTDSVVAKTPGLATTSGY